MATITANISASATTIPVSAPIDNGFYTIDSENVYVHGSSRGEQGRAFDRLFLSVDRGVGGSTAATHTSGATLTRYYPDAATGAGSGGVTVDNGVDPPASVATLVASGTTIDGDTATIGGGHMTIKGPLEINPETDQSDPTLHVSTPVGNATFRVLVDSADGDGTFSVDADGKVQIDAPTVPLDVLLDGDTVLRVDSSGKVLASAQDGNNATPAFDIAANTVIPTLLRLKTGANNTLTVEKTGAVTLTLRGGMVNIDDAVIGNLFNVSTFGGQFILPSGATLSVLDDAFATLFEVRSDGSVHIKTGTSIVADL